MHKGKTVKDSPTVCLSLRIECGMATAGRMSDSTSQPERNHDSQPACPSTAKFDSQYFTCKLIKIPLYGLKLSCIIPVYVICLIMKQTQRNLGGGILISPFLQYNLSATAIKVSIHNFNHFNITQSNSKGFTDSL